MDGLSGAEVSRLTGLSRNAVYQARKEVVKRLKELGAAYRDDGRLGARVKRALEGRADDVCHCLLRSARHPFSTRPEGQ
jgi:hypothetical protein